MDLQFEKYIYEEMLKIAAREHTKYNFATIVFHENKFDLIPHETDENSLEYYSVIAKRKIEFKLNFYNDEDGYFFLFGSPNISASGELINNQAICHKINYDKWILPNGEKIDWELLKKEKDDILNLIRSRVS